MIEWVSWKGVKFKSHELWEMGKTLYSSFNSCQIITATQPNQYYWNGSIFILKRRVQGRRHVDNCAINLIYQNH